MNNKLKNRNHTFLYVLLTLLLVGLPLTVYAKLSDESFFVNRNIPYTKGQTNYPNRLKLDVYSQQTEKKAPLIIYVHGGSWYSGDKTNIYAKPEHFTNKGYVLASINYRMAPEVTYDTMAKDISKAIAYLFKNKQRFGIDTNRVVLMGHSAGAHLVTLISTDNTYLKQVNLSPSNIKATVALDGFYNVSEFVHRNEMYYKAFTKDENVWKKASPLLQVKKGNKTPPILMVARDFNGRIHDAKRMQQKLVENGIPAQYYVAKDLSHKEVNYLYGETSFYKYSSKQKQSAIEMTKTADQFITKYMK